MSHKSLPTQGYPLAEEIANSISHGLGCLFGIVGLMLLLDKASVMNAGLTAIVSSSLYGGSMILLFLASTLYHAVSHPRAKRVLKKVDHCAIYLLIAGTYTPFLMVGLQSPLAYGLMAVIWGLALLGIIFKLTIAERFKALSLVTYLCMGWLSLIVVYQLAMKLSAGASGCWRRGHYLFPGRDFLRRASGAVNHAIWHAFVLGGCVCHFCAIYFYVM
ncbi:PAQR family membrane homeostasis protein TrhA [Pantoea ananatis]|nr:hemolysin III family protein [Pantoea ananatis]